MKNKREFVCCPICGASVRVVEGRIARHERGLGYVPYRLYHAFVRKHHELTVKELAKENLCTASGKMYGGELRHSSTGCIGVLCLVDL